MMIAVPRDEEFESCRVTYTLYVGGRFVVVENVPARVSRRTGERFFSPDTVERLQQIAWSQEHPVRVVETPVFRFPAAIP